MKKHKIKVIVKVKSKAKPLARDIVTRAMNLAMVDEPRIKTWGYPWEFKK